jgi:hypothetical protein
MNLSGYRDLYHQLPAQAVNKLTAAMQQLFENNVIHVLKSEQTNLAEFLIQMEYNRMDFNPQNFFARARQICQLIGSFSPQQFQEHSDLLTNYRFRLMKYPLNDFILSNHLITARQKFQLVLLFPVFILGAMLGAIPLLASRKIANKTVTRIDFHTSVESGVLGFTGLLWWVFLILLTWAIAGIIWVIPVLFMPLYFLLSWHWWKIWEKYEAQRRFNHYNNLDPQFLRGLLQVRQKLILE